MNEPVLFTVNCPGHKLHGRQFTGKRMPVSVEFLLSLPIVDGNVECFVGLDDDGRMFAIPTAHAVMS